MRILHLDAGREMRGGQWQVLRLVEGLAARMQTAMGEACQVIATGGLAPLIAKETESIGEVLEFLTLDGLRMVYERNRDDSPEPHVVRRGHKA